MLDNNSDARSLLKKMDHNPKAYFLFSPEGHYVNLMTLYSAIKKQLDIKYYGLGKVKKTGFGDEDKPVSFKGTPFHDCKIPYDVFHMQRRTKLTIK